MDKSEEKGTSTYAWSGKAPKTMAQITFSDGIVVRTFQSGLQ
ncbi:hypothetical protein [Ectobacillus polymachus]